MEQFVVTVDGQIVHGPSSEFEAHQRKRLLRKKATRKVKVKNMNTQVIQDHKLTSLSADTKSAQVTCRCGKVFKARAGLDSESKAVALHEQHMREQRANAGQN